MTPCELFSTRVLNLEIENFVYLAITETIDTNGYIRRKK